ncbi:MAG: dihydropteroate synthase [Proteobacteria bacterium]|nr:dihydropteroate synthase [Pseudomonadota bacterium]MCP4915761.1 dihydropteroate synthase [Pseudomonadota bacterium]
MLIAGILNLTPDSFSDGGRHDALVDAVRRGRQLAQRGAHWIDVGGESTRPGAEPVPVAEELRRVVPVVERLAADGLRISIDTRKPEVARAALRAGAVVVNDVGGFRDPDMVEVVASAHAGAVAMHMRGDPANMQADTRYDDVVVEVVEVLAQRVSALRSAGVESIWADPGIGFGKSASGCQELLHRLPDLRVLDVPLYVGASRKSFIGALADEPDPGRRLGGSLASVALAHAAGVEVVRVHDVRETAQFLRILER